MRSVMRAHARWDATSSKNVIDWLTLAQRRLPEFSAILATRLAQYPNDVVLLRIEQDGVSGAAQETICASHQRRARASPNRPDLRHLPAPRSGRPPPPPALLTEYPPLP